MPVRLSDDEADELLRTLAHPARREILRLCWDAPVTAGDLSRSVGLAAASMSEHLKVLRKSGLVVLTKEGTYRWYRADPSRLRRLERWLHEFVHP